MRTADFDYDLPIDLIAQNPATERDQSRLLVLSRSNLKISHLCFGDLPRFLRPEDVLVLNDSRVISARLSGIKTGSGGRVEILLVQENSCNDWWVMLRPGRRVHVETTIELVDRSEQHAGISARLLDKDSAGRCRLLFSGTPNIFDDLERIGEVPLPPYIQRCSPIDSANDRDRYQNVFARAPGSVAAPTAGLHFTRRLLDEIRKRSVRVGFVTLHVGLGTFAPVKATTLERHFMHAERFQIGSEILDAVRRAKLSGGRVVAVGTTTVRVLESAAAGEPGRWVPVEGHTRLFIRPPYQFKVVDALITNFHLPRSTLLMLVSAFASPGKMTGRKLILNTYAEAIRERYRFYSYGDAMLIL